MGSQWVYRIKYHSDGRIEGLKSRLVVFGNHRQAGIDYNEAFALVAKIPLFLLFWPLLLLEIGSFIIWIFTMPSYMVTLMRKFI